MLDKNAILSANDVVKELVHVPEWGGDVYVRTMSGDARDEWETAVLAMNENGKRVTMKGIRAKLASLTICDENGELLFTESDLTTLGKKSASALQRVFMVAQRLSAITPEDVKELKDGLEKSPFDSSVST